MKKIKYLIYGALFMVFVFSCSKENLKVDFPKLNEDQFFNNEANIERGVRGVYAKLTDLYIFRGGNPCYPLGILPDDLFTQDKGGSRLPLDNFKGFLPSENLTTKSWAVLTQVVNYANTMIDVTEKYKDRYTTEGLKDVHQGECYFLRGYAFYKLWVNWGKPPIITKRITDVDDPAVYSKETSGLAGLDSAISSMKKAEVLLANKKQWDAQNVGRVTLNSIEGFLVKLYVIRANYGTTKTQDYQNAIAAFNKIDQSITTIQEVKYGDNFDGHTENNKESLFEFQSGEPALGSNIWYDTNERTEENVAMGACFMFFNLTGWTWAWGQPIIPTAKLINKFNPQDPRFLECMDTVSLYKAKYNRQNLPMSMLWSTGFVFHKYLRPAIYDTWDSAGIIMHSKGGVKITTIKYPARDTYGVGGYGFTLTTNNVRILRFADVKLLAAEAYLETGDAPSALTQVNDVRERARVSSINGVISPEPAALSSIDRQAIMDERIRELCGEEDHRLVDMRRWQQAGWIDIATWVPQQPGGPIIENCWGITSNPTDFDATFFTTKHLLFPIPLSETSVNTNVTQNDGY